MKKLALLAIVSAFMLGCAEKQAPQPQQVAPPPQVEAPPVEPQPEYLPPPPSSSFLRGYWDGYHGRWVGPFSWVLSDDYRNGHTIGERHRREGLDPQYPMR